METKLNATFQKSYYGKAHVITNDDGTLLLRSYETIVCEYDPNTNTFRKLWNGYSRTTMKHINDFRKLCGLSMLIKKEWDSIPFSGDEQGKWKVEFSNGFVSWVAETVFGSYDEAWSFAERIMEERNYSICADVFEV